MATEDAHPPAGAGTAQAHALAAEPDDAGAVDKPSLATRGMAFWDWVKHTRPMRANARFGARSGGVLTGGIAYSTLFSVFAALTIGYTIFMRFLGDNELLRAQMLKSIDDALPGLIDTGDGSGGAIDPDALVLNTQLTLASIVAAVVLLLSAIAAVAALRRAVRAMFADDNVNGNGMRGKVRELGGFACFALAFLASAILTIAVTSATQWVLGALGLSGYTTTILTVLGIAVGFVVDATVFVLIVTVLADQHPARKDLVWGATFAGIGLGVVRLLGTAVVAGSVHKNPLFTSVIVLVTLLVWINLLARIILLVAAWTADPPYVDKLALSRTAVSRPAATRQEEGTRTEHHEPERQPR
ncbi:YihY/virulence factor BrkB family protein [Cellulomonas sp. URHD0024]|uniref:YihY/virulence factor BrkB family protein n=1 Tax=Cellulomonas sp. URHD0024 TaxID=1302620 RepID=UPI0009DBD92C|nr:YihY/virulence factor BrkB family protein [Cellulomonas sp. URHD0024]